MYQWNHGRALSHPQGNIRWIQKSFNKKLFQTLINKLLIKDPSIQLSINSRTNTGELISTLSSAIFPADNRPNKLPLKIKNCRQIILQQLSFFTMKRMSSSQETSSKRSVWGPNLFWWVLKSQFQKTMSYKKIGLSLTPLQNNCPPNSFANLPRECTLKTTHHLHLSILKEPPNANFQSPWLTLHLQYIHD